MDPCQLVPSAFLQHSGANWVSRARSACWASWVAMIMHESLPDGHLHVSFKRETQIQTIIIQNGPMKCIAWSASDLEKTKGDTTRERHFECFVKCSLSYINKISSTPILFAPVVPARGGAEVALRLYYKMFFIYTTCMRRAPARPVRALGEPVALLLSKNMTCARPRRNATSTPSEHFLRTSHCTLHTPRSTLHTCTSHSTLHLISNHVSSSHLISALLISSHLFSHVIYVSSTTQLFSSHPSTDQPFSSPHLLERLLNSSRLFCAPENPYYQTEVSCTEKPLRAESFCPQKLDTQMHLHRKAFTKCLVLQSLHKALPSTSL